MTWEGYWLPNLLQWTIGPVFTVLIGLYLKRLLRLNREQVQRMLDVAEAVVGGVRASPATRPVRAVPSVPDREEATVDLARFRKGFAAGFGVLLITLLTYAVTSTEVRDMLEAILPPQLVPLVAPVLGGIALVVSVVKARNAPEPSPYRRGIDPELAAHYGSPDTVAAVEAPTILEPAPPADGTRVQLAAGSASPEGTAPTSPAAPEPPREDPMPSGAADDAAPRPDLALTGVVQLSTVPSRIDYR